MCTYLSGALVPTSTPIPMPTLQESELCKKRKKCESLEQEARKKHKRCEELVSCPRPRAPIPRPSRWWGTPNPPCCSAGFPFPGLCRLQVVE